MKKLGGIKLSHNKNTQSAKTVDFIVPDRVVIPMSQSMGASCEPLVNKGDVVFVGQKIGDSDKFMSVPVHSSVSGKVLSVDDFLLSNGAVCKSVVIETDKNQTIDSDVKPPEVSDRQSFIRAIRESGLAGLGGAGFPTHVKFAFDPAKTPIDSLIINGAECEPFITSDNREFLEFPDDVLDGVRLVMKYLEIPKCIICIEANKPEAIKLMTEKTAQDSSVEIKKLPSKYPQGAEKVIIYSATGRIVAAGALPSSVGVMVMNVSSVSFVSKYLKTGTPLISKRITLDGDACKKNAGNYNVLIGTPVSALLEHGGADEFKKVLYGGPMMGLCLYDSDQPVVKTTNAVLAFKEVKDTPVTPCIRCGSCIRACPMGLMPVSIETAYKLGDKKALSQLGVLLCINCGCCTYVCPAKRPLAETNQLAKTAL